MKRQTKQKAHPQVVRGLPVHHPNAGGIDVGDTRYDVAVSDGQGGYITRVYSTFTEDLIALVKWLVSLGIDTVAMESTGVYWLNLYLMLEQEGITPYLVNARHAKNVTGRKKDDTDAIWLQKLHSCGLLQKSFQPDSPIRELRDYMRHRKSLVNRGADSARRMQKAFEMMNIKLHTVISDLLGKTGLAIVESIIAGERDPLVLARMRDRRIKADEQTLRKSLEGIYRNEYVFLLNQAYQEYKFYQTQLKACEQKIADCLLAQAAAVQEGDISGLKLKKKAL